MFHIVSYSRCKVEDRILILISFPQVSRTLSTRDPNKLHPSMALNSISPTSTIYTFPSSSSVTDGNISMVATSDNTNTGTKSDDDPNSKILLFIIIAIIPTLLLLILIAIVLFRRVKEREAEPFYKIQVEYTDDTKPRRPRCANSRLDLTIKGMHIDLEFPSPGEKRKSARLSAPPNLSDAQMRELQKLSQECKENLEWINEVLERELDAPVFLGGSSSSENDDSMDTACINQRYSVYSACSEKEKENYEVSEKIIKRDSPEHTKNKVKNGNELVLYSKNDDDYDDDGSDSGNSKDDSDELKIKLDQRTSPKAPPKPQKPEIPPKPKITLTATDRIGTMVNPLSSTIFIECAAHGSEGEGRNKTDTTLVKNNTPKERTLLRKPPIPERKGKLARKPDNSALTKHDVSSTVENEAKKDSPCLCNRLSKPPIPRKPEGLVINRFQRKPGGDVSGKITTTLYRSGRKLDVSCAPRKACQAV